MGKCFLKVHNNLNLHIKTEHVTVLAVMLVPGSDRWKPLLCYIRSSSNRTVFMRKFRFVKTNQALKMFSVRLLKILIIINESAFQETIAETFEH